MIKLLYKNVVFRNLVFYILIGCTIAAVNLSGVEEVFHENPAYLIQFLGFYTLTYLLCFLHNRIFFERFLSRKKYFPYFISIVTAVFLWTFITESTNQFSWETWINTFIGGFLTMFFGFGLYMIFQSVFMAQWQLKNDLTKTRNELAQLRAQLDPHFLFNALNNLYGASVSEPDKVPGYVLMLSDLLRYQIESTKRERVKLTDELKFITQFVEYEKIKLAHRGKITLLMDVHSNSLVISPMILFQFVENALKFSGQLAEPMVSIRITLVKKQLSFECQNTFNQGFRESTKGTKTGLINTRQRLDLQYPNQYSLTISESKNVFKANLVITLLHYEI
jgi:hypothetical protein